MMIIVIMFIFTFAVGSVYAATGDLWLLAPLALVVSPVAAMILWAGISDWLTPRKATATAADSGDAAGRPKLIEQINEPDGLSLFNFGRTNAALAPQRQV